MAEAPSTPVRTDSGAAAGKLNLAVIAGDGIGPEVVAEGLKVLDAAASGTGLSVSTTEFDLGAARWHRTGEVLPAGTVDQLRAHDAILLGAVGDPSVPSGVLERQLLLALRFELDHYVNLRPAKLYPGVASPLDVAAVAPGGIDFVVVREGTEGPYAGNGGILRAGTPHEIATEVSVNTRFGIERVVRDAFARAAARERKHLTLVHKHNVLSHAGHLWRRVVEHVGQEYPQVTTAYCHVDAATIFMVTDNLFGDILTDLAGAIAGGIGLAASGNINPARTAPSMFEPVHGSAPDIAGTGKADPTATILSAGMLLEHAGATAAAARIEAAVAADLAERGSTPRSTSQIGDDIAARLRR